LLGESGGFGNAETVQGHAHCDEVMSQHSVDLRKGRDRCQISRCCKDRRRSPAL
jgi:hypothetical protein